MKKWTSDQMSGVYSALFTPYDRKGKINPAMLEKLVEYQLDAGLRGFYVTGSTGEAFLLSESERKAVLEHVIRFVAGRATVIAHVGHVSTDTACALARHADKAGADWISSVGPVYYGQSFPAAVRHYTAIAGATDRPFMLYAIGTEIVPDRDAALFDIPNVCAMKYTGANFFSVQQLRAKLNRPVLFFSGFDEQSVASLSFGFDGSIGTTQNIMPDRFVRIFKLYRQDRIKEAAKIQAETNAVIALMVRSENRSYQKALMRYAGFDCGWFRAPFAPLTEDEYQAFAAEVEALGILPRNDR